MPTTIETREATLDFTSSEQGRPRVTQLFVDDVLFANALNLILAQRLVRVLCDTCKKPVKPTPAQNLRMGHALDGVPQIYAPAGCKRCLRTGFIGRRAIFATTTPDKSYLAVVTRGEEAIVEGQVDEDPKLWMIKVDEPGAKPVPFEIGSPFDRLAIASDGNTAVAYFSQSGPDSRPGIPSLTDGG